MRRPPTRGSGTQRNRPVPPPARTQKPHPSPTSEHSTASGRSPELEYSPEAERIAPASGHIAAVADRGQRAEKTPGAGHSGRRPSAFRRGESPLVAQARAAARTQPKRLNLDRFQNLPVLNVTHKHSQIPWLAVALVAVLALILIAPNVYTYINQQQQARQVSADLAAAKAEQAELQAQLKQWSDPDFITAQARKRLGYLRPGETQYRVSDLPVESTNQAPQVPKRPWFLVITETNDAAAKERDPSQAADLITGEAGVPAAGATPVPAKKDE